jgi:ribosomal peptide maturation radical SAM protein 1
MEIFSSPLPNDIFLATRDREKPKVILVVPPFASPAVPSLGPSLLLEGCLKRNIDCRIFYPNLIFASMVGHDLYRKIIRIGHFFGDALFAPYAFDLNKDEMIQLLFKYKNSLKVIRSENKSLSVEEYLECDNLIPAFLDCTVVEIIKYEPAILGFSSVFEQNTASLAIAKRIKQIFPAVITVMGGGNVTLPMGGALMDIAPMIDYVFSGYADEEFPQFCNNFFSDGMLPQAKIIICQAVDDLDQVEIPNYTDYFQQLKDLQQEDLLPDAWPDFIIFESSRGCWWGEKCQCVFCGQNAINLTYRKKKEKRIIKEIIHLKKKYGVNHLLASDNVMPEDFDGVLEKLINLGEEIVFLYEVRSNLKPSLLDNFVRAGVIQLQPGIESLSSHLLKKMRKGVTALQNLQLLREACSRQINLRWNMLLVPGETARDYEQILTILPTVEHFQPPSDWGPIRIDRYSPYFNNPMEFGIKSVEPYHIYNIIYPSETKIEELAYYFKGEYDSILTINNEIGSIIYAQLNEWYKLWEDKNTRPRLYRFQVSDGISMIKDTRRVAQQTFTALDKESWALLEILNEPNRGEAVPDALITWLPELLERKFVIFIEDHYISLVTDPQIGINLRKNKNR